jgi:type I restriction enzyme M protein
MTAEQLRQLENQLWTAADQLRANSKLTATEYSFPVLGLIFLRHAYNRFRAAEISTVATLPVHAQRGKRALTKDDFLQAKAIYLPQQSQWKYLAELPEGHDIGQAIDEAMRRIEEQYDVLEGVLPRNYSIFEKRLLHTLVRIFNNPALNEVTGDIFGRIYEYFLNKFAMTGAQEGGEFFTPPSLVNAIVQIIEPHHGIVFDPACGSGGMFVQTGHFIEEEEHADPSTRVTFYGQEKADTNTRLAKMNMAVHGLDASILQGNTFYEDQHGMTERCDYVMANPPFNVDGVDKDRDYVREDARLPFGLPKNDNANYLWIQYFYAYLNPTGRAGFVMASSASDAGHSEKEIRRQLVETGAVDVMVSIGTKFFYTRSLPCTLWFFDRAKERDPERADKTLMLDLREVYRKVSSNLHDFTAEQLTNIHAIAALYRGNPAPFQKAVQAYDEKAQDALEIAHTTASALISAHLVMLDGDTFDLDHLKSQKRDFARTMNEHLAELKESLKENDKAAQAEIKNKMREIEEQLRVFNEAADEAIHFDKEYRWLTSRFPDAVYVDVPGLCRVVSRELIVQNDYSLTPGRYVGVASKADDGFDFEERMGEIKIELIALNEESIVLVQRIQDQLNEIGL